MKKEYKAKKGGIIKQKDAQKIGERLDYLRSKKITGITVEDVLKDSKNKNTPYHKYFEWGNDAKCAYNWRKAIARAVMNSVVVTIKVDGKSMEQRSFFNVKDCKGKSVYVKFEEVAQNKNYLHQLIGDAQQYIVYLNNVLTMLMQELKKVGK